MLELQPDEPGLHEVRRILREWITDARGSLDQKQVSDEDVHDARKQLKKSRAALRLLRDAIGEIAYERENAALRDVAQPLSAVRDSKVLLATLVDLLKAFRSKERTPDVNKFRAALRREQAQAKQVLSSTALTKQRKALQTVIRRSSRWNMKADDGQAIGDGLKRSYRSGRKKLATAAVSSDDEHLHDWRKQVKYLWHELQVLQPLRPGVIGELADQTHKLADYLGDDHDLAVLRQKIVNNETTFDASDREALLDQLDRRRQQLQDKALLLGKRIYATKPRKFRRAFTGFWQAWRKSPP